MDSWGMTALVSAGVLIYSLNQFMQRSRIIEKACSYQTPNGRITIEIVETVEQCNNAVDTLKRHCRTYKILGFDCEWIQDRSVALLQIATNQGYCVLFRLCRIREIPPSLCELLENRDLLKVGIMPLEDARKLFTDFNLNVRGTFDLRYLAILVNRTPAGLAGLALSVIGVRLNKDLTIRISNWEADPLSDDQIDYAANDALIAIELYKRMKCEFNQAYDGNLGQQLQSKLDIFFR